ncbi:MAG: FAD-dependent oxidoreductase [Calditrichaeota bacterium]|nr:FAD-dependent oxidoreductase [Calditrichota bacterium]
MNKDNQSMLAPCINGCPQGTDICAILAKLSHSEKPGQSKERSFEEAWEILTDTNPLPAICGRVCPHNCESACNRNEKDTAVAFNNIERFLGDYGIEHDLKYTQLPNPDRPEKVAIIGAGPAGLSCAYQLVRRGYSATIFEALPKAGGMLRYGIPDYRLPRDVIDAEVAKIVDLGVELRTGVEVGKDISYEEIESEFNSVFIGIGAHKGAKLYCPGEETAGVYSGAEFLRLINSGESVDVGENVVVVGGGDTAIDAARVSRRLGANVTILYRRTRSEMPAYADEIVGGEEEGVKLHFLAAPIEIKSENGHATTVICQRMELGEPDRSGRRRPIPIDGDTFTLPVSSVIAAISQAPSWGKIDQFQNRKGWIDADMWGSTRFDNVYTGGDDTGLGLVTSAIADGRRAADAIHARLTKSELPVETEPNLILPDRLNLQVVKSTPRHDPVDVGVEKRLQYTSIEIRPSLTADDVIAESQRCINCGHSYIKPKSNPLHFFRRFTQLGIGTILLNSYFAVGTTKQIYGGQFRMVCVPGLNCHACPTATMGCPIGMLQYFAANHRFPWFLIGFVGIIGLLSGRFTCGWLCPWGFFQDITNFFKRITVPIPRILGYGKYVALVLLCIVLPYITYEHWFSALCPCGALIAGIPWAVWNPIDPVFDGPVIAADGIGMMFWIKMWILGVCLALFMFIKRPFCRTVCPLGGLYAFFNRISLVSLKVKPECSDCGQCRELCPVDIEPQNEINSEPCIKCLECTQCEHINFDVNWPGKPSNGFKKIPVQVKTEVKATV